jgi:hypothetical protein
MNRARIVWVAAAALIVVFAIWVVTLSPLADSLPVQLQGWRTVGSYFDRPPDYPGKRWSNEGRAVSSEELMAAAGPAHCSWGSITMMYIGWPLGTRSTNAAEARQYIRDPGHTLQPQVLKGTWARDPSMPADASDTGYRYGAVRLFLAPSDDDTYAYLVAPADSERWPRSDPMTLCV